MDWTYSILLVVPALAGVAARLVVAALAARYKAESGALHAEIDLKVNGLVEFRRDITLPLSSAKRKKVVKEIDRRLSSV